MKSIEGSGSGNMTDVSNKIINKSEKHKLLIRGSICILGGILIHICLGTVYSFGAISAYLISYFKLVAGYGDAINISDSASLIAAEFSGMAIAMPIGGIFVPKLGSRAVSLIGGAILVISTICGRFCLTSWPAFYMVFGACYGFGLGFAYTAPLIACLRWFPEQKGLVSGLITAGFGSGSVIFAPLQIYLLNPSGFEADLDKTYFSQQSILNNVPNMFSTIGACYATMIIVGTILLLHKEEEEIKVEKSENSSSTNVSAMSDKSMNILLAVRCPEFWFLYTMFMSATMGVIYLATFWKNLALDINGDPCLSEASLAAVAAVGSASNAFGRIFWGKLSDIWGWRCIIVILSAIWSICIFLLSYASNIHASVYVLLICLSFCCLGGNYSIFPSATIDVFGQNGIAKVYGFVFSAQMVSSFFVAFFCQALMEFCSIPTLCRIFAVATLYPVFTIGMAHLIKYEWKPHPCCAAKV